jgi:hypothetical protein
MLLREAIRIDVAHLEDDVGCIIIAWESGKRFGRRDATFEKNLDGPDRDRLSARGLQ